MVSLISFISVLYHEMADIKQNRPGERSILLKGVLGLEIDKVIRGITSSQLYLQTKKSASRKEIAINICETVCFNLIYNKSEEVK